MVLTVRSEHLLDGQHERLRLVCECLSKSFIESTLGPTQIGPELLSGSFLNCCLGLQGLDRLLDGLKTSLKGLDITTCLLYLLRLWIANVKACA